MSFHNLCFLRKSKKKIFIWIHFLLFGAMIHYSWILLLQRLWFLLDQYHTPPLVGEDQMINYEDFLKVANEAGVKCQ